MDKLLEKWLVEQTPKRPWGPAEAKVWSPGSTDVNFTDPWYCSYFVYRVRNAYTPCAGKENQDKEKLMEQTNTRLYSI